MAVQAKCAACGKNRWLNADRLCHQCQKAGRLCYPASEALFHTMGGSAAGLTPMRVRHEGVSHWYLRWETGGQVFYLDPTASQFKTPVPYADGKGCGFLTKDPSKRALALMTREEQPCCS